MNQTDHHKKVLSFQSEAPPPSPSTEKARESTELNKLFEALAKAQLEMEVAKTDSVNPYFKSKYADLASVVKASRPFLAKNGLCVIQRMVTYEKQAPRLFTRLCHSSGQWIESSISVSPPKQDIQTLGSHLTYLRRYMYAALTGVVASDEDDDAEFVMGTERKESSTTPNARISKAQLQVLANELSDHADILESLLKGFNICKMAELPSKHYSKCLERIREIKMSKEATDATH